MALARLSREYTTQQELFWGIWHSAFASLPAGGKKFHLFFSFTRSHLHTTAICGPSLCTSLQGLLMKTAATLRHCLPELCSEQSKTTHMASCHTLTAGHCWQVQPSTELACFGTNRSLTTSQSSARSAKHNGGAGRFNSQCVPAAAAKVQTRKFKQRPGISTLQPTLLETSVETCSYM